MFIIIIIIIIIPKQTIGFLKHEPIMRCTDWISCVCFQRYIADNAYGSVTPELLWTALQQVGL